MSPYPLTRASSHSSASSPTQEEVLQNTYVHLHVTTSHQEAPIDLRCGFLISDHSSFDRFFVHVKDKIKERYRFPKKTAYGIEIKFPGLMDPFRICVGEDELFQALLKKIVKQAKIVAVDEMYHLQGYVLMEELPDLMTDNTREIGHSVATAIKVEY
jgi:hypothetical protein